MAFSYNTVKALLTLFQSSPKLQAALYRIYRMGKRPGWAHHLDEEALEREVGLWYLAERGEAMDFAKPQAFSEKMQWLKVHDRDPRKTTLSDKLEVRAEIAAKAGEEVLPKVYAEWEDPQEISFGGLPSRFMLKCNNGSGMMLRVDNSAEADMEEVRSKAKNWLACDFASRYFEMQYAAIRPRVYAEELLDDIEWEYQAWCFSGKAEFIAAIRNPHGINEKQFFTPEWNKLPFVSSQPEYKGVIDRPDCLSQVIEWSERLAEGFCFVRVDWYGTSHGPVFSEMSFTPACGVVKWDPAEYNMKVGELVQLPDGN